MPERSFKEEVKQLTAGDGDYFEGEGILAVTKALLQSGISYVGGYQGAPVSALVDVLSDAKDLLDDLGVHLETNANEAGAAAMLSASINYPIRGAVTFKSVVGTNVASDAISNLCSPGVVGGALIVVGEDYGEGSSIIQERSHAFAMKSQMWLLDPRPDLQNIVNLVESSFELSEASNTPVMMELRIRACHMTGRFNTKSNVRPKYSRKDLLPEPVFDKDRISLPPATYIQEKLKIEKRWPAAIDFIRDHALNEIFAADADVGIILQGGMYNNVIAALRSMGLADLTGKTQVPMLVLNCVYPLVPDEIASFCKGKKAVLVVEEGQPAFIEPNIKALLSDAEVRTKIHGKDCLPLAGEYSGHVMLEGMIKFFKTARSTSISYRSGSDLLTKVDANRRKALEILGEPVPSRPPGFCTGCPERPVFSAIKLVQNQVGKLHVSADVGCHSFATLEPFSIGNTILGYGLGLASSVGLSSMMKNPIVSIMGDGGFWHQGLTTGVANHVFNKDEGVLVILKNGYASATGHQHIPSTGSNSRDQASEMDIEAALRGVGVKWIKKVHSYRIGSMIDALKSAIGARGKGLRVIIAEGECMLAKQRREKPMQASKLKKGDKVVRTRYGVDESTCTGDHSCIRLSGCPTLTIKSSSDPLRKSPVAHVTSGCVGCGNCGEVAHAAILCPSFHRLDIVQNPTLLDRFMFRVRASVIGFLQNHQRAAA
ncbi:indolepyruvate ferredoxin oxidoreductase subunit alpha [Agrobacterium tumefaciens]|uniref:thiamine pyrophosphate-dependent enzyme n=1 Tax=Agrobacterium tumefaciens TaxID=358 RepID=UPI0015729E17|nr:indolepyruvate ferredoxin oxidoreductase subunit alpha [Agrobacterium tumefaciens]NTC82586.1 indolepyruvate ferredoxin oxidoreductase subunit alpha [Agrobacterium tumefaciens]NTD11409.1 indolepyruvate ferredoxin oxidoreductase subunit alpha [Agrobacterium tumefaciens]NTD86730.1 indolepyruvate ferredoxin oxidoreductase subunit alpha [Agrobacterium tumefaciens]NTD91457.1 indolepyruvate ferredoxin oxidoreductase subunit alpha [Agrobacterium tumefaciens]NTD96928.1 indolepyruvate ferredoxin oxid